MTIQPMTRKEQDLAAELAADEGWNQGVHDADAFGFLGFSLVAPECHS